MNDWHTSSYSVNGANCVEIREHTYGADVRDSQHRGHGHVTFPAAEWSAFLRDVRSGQL